MLFALVLALTSIAGATVLTYAYDRDASVAFRLCTGVCTGFSAFGLVGFIISSIIGLHIPALAVSALIAASPLLLLRNRSVRARLRTDIHDFDRTFRLAILHPGRGVSSTLIFYCIAAVLLWLVFDRAMYETPEGIFTGVDNNIGDLPFHLSIITGFAHGQNFPPQHPEFAGVSLTYPFIADFVAAMFVRAGASLEGALFWSNFAMALSLTGLLHRWGLVLTRSSMAGLLTPIIVLLSGGFGFIELIREAASSGAGVVGMLGALPHDYTNMGELGYRWGNAITTLLIPQRGLLLGLPLALVVMTLWARWLVIGTEPDGATSEIATRTQSASKAKIKAGGKRHKKLRVDEDRIEPRIDNGLSRSSRGSEMIAAGVIAGLLPLVHAHSFVVVMLTGACLALLFADLKAATAGSVNENDLDVKGLLKSIQPWLVFAAVASLIALPQILWATNRSAARVDQFFGWDFGWDNGEHNVIWFWIKNTALFIPMLVAALIWRSDGKGLIAKRLKLFFLPFLLCFIVPNVYKLSPWVWDNIKVLFYWWVAATPLVALLLARFWAKGGWWRALTLVLVLVQVCAGSLDVWRVASQAVERQTYDRSGIDFAKVITSSTAPHSLILHAPTYNDPVYLTGRRSFAGYDGHLWSHGIDYGERFAELKRIYSGGPDAQRLLEQRAIDYVVVGPLERAELQKLRSNLNESFFQRYTKVGEAGEYRLYKTRP